MVAECRLLLGKKLRPNWSLPKREALNVPLSLHVKPYVFPRLQHGVSDIYCLVPTKQIMKTIKAAYDNTISIFGIT